MSQLTNSVNNKLRNLYNLLNLKSPKILPKYAGKTAKITILKNSNIKNSEQYLMEEHQKSDIDINDLALDDNGNFIINGKYNSGVFFIYKKKMYLSGNPENKYFHLCSCKYLQNVNPQNHAASTIPSLLFLREYEQSDFSWEIKLEPLKLCRDCFEILNLRSRQYSLYNFDIERYYKEELKYKAIPDKRFNHLRKNSQQQRYLFNWPDIRDFTLKNQHFTCQKCGQKFANSLEEYHLKYNKNSSKYLEVHHRNKNKYDNSIANLQVLCNICHDMEHPFRPK